MICSGPDKQFEIKVIGKKAHDALVGLKIPTFSFQNQTGNVNFAYDTTILQDIVKEYRAKKFDELYLLYMGYVTTVKQKPVCERLLPVFFPEGEANTNDYNIIEPDELQIIDYIVKQYLEYRYHLANYNSVLSEHCSRLVAMTLATKNGKEMLEDLKLTYNKLRQSRITKELLEVISSTEGLRGQQ